MRLLVVKQLVVSWTWCCYLNMLLSSLTNYFDNLGCSVFLSALGLAFKMLCVLSLSLSCGDSLSFLLPPGPTLVQNLPSSVQMVCESWNNISTNEFPNIGSWVSVHLPGSRTVEPCLVSVFCSYSLGLNWLPRDLNLLQWYLLWLNP